MELSAAWTPTKKLEDYKQGTPCEIPPCPKRGVKLVPSMERSVTLGKEQAGARAKGTRREPGNPKQVRLHSKNPHFKEETNCEVSGQIESAKHATRLVLRFPQLQAINDKIH